MLWALVSSVYVIYLYRKLRCGAGPKREQRKFRRQASAIDAELDKLDQRLAALESRLPGAECGGRAMMAAIFIAYMAIIWLVFDKLRLIRLSLPLALVLAAVGPLFAFYRHRLDEQLPSVLGGCAGVPAVVQVVPHITAPGRVLEVVAQPNAPMKKGDVLFTIDPQQFQFEVKRLEAALAAAEQSVPQLKSSVDQATAGVEKANVQLNLAKAEFDRQAELFEKKVVAQAMLDRAERNLETAQQAVAEAKAAEERARLAYQSNIGSENTAVAQARQQLAQAKYNVEESVVRAPCDGYATNVQLVPGAVVSAAASVMPFVCDRDERNAGVVVASFMQGPYLQIKPGDYAEVVLPMYPGQVFPGKVLTTIDIASEGQLSASGSVSGVPSWHRAVCRPHPARRCRQAPAAGRHPGQRGRLYRQRPDRGRHPHGVDADDELDQLSVLYVVRRFAPSVHVPQLLARHRPRQPRKTAARHCRRDRPERAPAPHEARPHPAFQAPTCEKPDEACQRTGLDRRDRRTLLLSRCRRRRMHSRGRSRPDQDAAPHVTRRSDGSTPRSAASRTRSSPPSAWSARSK